MVRAFTTTMLLAVAMLLSSANADELTSMIQQDLITLGYALESTEGEMNVETAVAISQFQAERGIDVTGEISPQLAGILKAAIRNPDMPAPATQAAAETPAEPAPTGQPQQGQTPSLGSTMTAVAGDLAPAMVQGAVNGVVQGATGVDPSMLQAVLGEEPAQQPAAIDPATMQAMQLQATQMIGGVTGMDPAAIEAMQAMQVETMQQQAADQAQQACLEKKIADAQAAQESQKRRRGFGSLMRAVSRLGGNKIADAYTSTAADVAEAGAVISDLESAARDLGLTEEDVASCSAA